MGGEKESYMGKVKKMTFEEVTAKIDKNVRCVECGEVFSFGVAEQLLYKEKGWTTPRRCPDHRKSLPPPDTIRRILLKIYKSCYYCGRKFGGEPDENGKVNDDYPTLEHLKPKALGGKSRFDNCVLACLGCNVSKVGQPDLKYFQSLSYYKNFKNWKAIKFLLRDYFRQWVRRIQRKEG